MSFIQELKNKRDEKTLEFAKEFIDYIKPKLVESAEKGYSGSNFKIDTDTPEEKSELQLYSSDVFIDHLNENLGGVKVEYQKVFKELPPLKGFGLNKHYLVFSW